MKVSYCWPTSQLTSGLIYLKKLVKKLFEKTKTKVNSKLWLSLKNRIWKFVKRVKKVTLSLQSWKKNVHDNDFFTVFSKVSTVLNNNLKILIDLGWLSSSSWRGGEGGNHQNLFFASIFSKLTPSAKLVINKINLCETSYRNGSIIFSRATLTLSMKRPNFFFGPKLYASVRELLEK